MRDESKRPEEHALRVMLEEKLGGQVPPDLSAQIGEAVERDLAGREAEVFAEVESSGLFGQAVGFMAEHAKWWLIPFLLIFALVGFALVLGSSGAAPFIYTMF